MPRRKALTTKQIHAEHWENHEAVVIRSLNTDDEEHIQDEIASLDDKGNAKIHTGRIKRLTLQRGIVSWTLTDEHNRPLPLNEQSIRGLAGEDSKYILDQINEISAPLPAEEKKDSSTPVIHGVEVAAVTSHSR